MIITETEKLYSPLNIYLRDNDMLDEYDNNQYWRDEFSHEEAAGYLDNIELFLRRDHDRFGNDRGIMAYCRSDALSDKVYSLLPSVELHGDKLWMVAELRLSEPLTPRDMADLKSWWGGQLSDGWGEGIEQREIKVDRGELYLEPWTSSAGFFIATQEEFAKRFGLDYLARATKEQETPGQAPEGAPAVRKPDNAELDALKLSVLLDKNLSDYTDSLLRLEKMDIIGKAEEIAATASAHFYLSEEHEFTASEVAFLLKFVNPLKVVADHWPTMNGLVDVSHVLPDIFRQPVTMQKRYALAPGESGAPEDGAHAESGPDAQNAVRKMDAREFQEKMSLMLGSYNVDAMERLISFAEELELDGACDTDIYFGDAFVEFYLVTRQYGTELARQLLDLYDYFSLNTTDLRGASHLLWRGTDPETINLLACRLKCERSTMENEEFEKTLTAFKDGLLDNPGNPINLSELKQAAGEHREGWHENPAGTPGGMDARAFQDKMSVLIPGYNQEAMRILVSYAEELDRDGTCGLGEFFRDTYIEYHLVARQYGPELSRQLFDVNQTFTLNPFEVRGASHHLHGGADAERIGQLARDGECDQNGAEWKESGAAKEAFERGELENQGGMEELSVSGEDAQKEELFDRLERNYDSIMSVLRGDITRPGLTQQELVNKAGEIAAVDDAYFYMTEHHKFDTSEVIYLMQFQNPLEVVADAWKQRTEDISDMSFALNEVFDKQDALRGGYGLVCDIPVTAKENKRGSDVAEKPSVLAQIREAAQAPKEPRKDKPSQDKTGPEH